MSLRDAKQMPLYASASEAESFIDVEPITGKTMRLCIRMIVSASTNSTDFDVFYPKLFKVSVPCGFLSMRQWIYITCTGRAFTSV